MQMINNDLEGTLDLISKGVKDVIWQLDFSSRKISFSERWQELTGFSEIDDSYSLNNLYEIINKDDYYIVLDNFNKLLAEKSPFLIMEIRIRHINGYYKWVLCHGFAEFDPDGTLSRMAGSLTDLTENRALEEQLNLVCNFDTLTGLPNLKCFEEKLNDCIGTPLLKGFRNALLFIDIDGFKRFYDNYGVHIGNSILKHIAENLKKSIRDIDTITRVDGDQFAVLLPNLSDKNDAVNIANNIFETIRAPIQAFGNEFFVSASIGITTFKDCRYDITELLRRASSASYSAKKLGKNKYQFYESEANEELIKKYSLENDLRYAIDSNEFIIHYQPQIEVDSGKLKGLEALIRWNHPQRGLIAPGEFIQVAEDSDLIIPMGNWILKSACAQNKVWQSSGLIKIPVSVNISPKQLMQNDFIEQVKAALEETSLEPEYLELEITESTLMQSMKTSIDVLSELRALGIKISLDDFGTGYSSLNYLRSLPIDKIKIDRTFVKDISINQNVEAILSAVIFLSKKMNLEIIAEGVETLQQLVFLNSQGCNLIQGYLYSKPLCSSEIENILKNEKIILKDSSFFNHGI